MKSEILGGCYTTATIEGKEYVAQIHIHRDEPFVSVELVLNDSDKFNLLSSANEIFISALSNRVDQYVKKVNSKQREANHG